MLQINLDVCELLRLDKVPGGVLEELVLESKGSALLMLQDQGAVGRL